MDKKIFAEMSKPVIKELFAVMKTRGLTISATAKLLGVGRRALQRWHDGTHAPKSLAKIMLLARAVQQLKAECRIEQQFTWGKKEKIPTAKAIIKEHGRVMKKQGF